MKTLQNPSRLAKKLWNKTHLVLQVPQSTRQIAHVDVVKQIAALDTKQHMVYGLWYVLRFFLDFCTSWMKRGKNIYKSKWMYCTRKVWSKQTKNTLQRFGLATVCETPKWIKMEATIHHGFVLGLTHHFWSFNSFWVVRQPSSIALVAKQLPNSEKKLTTFHVFFTISHHLH